MATRKRKKTPDYQYVRAFLEKDWGLPERLRLESAAQEFHDHGAAGSLAIADGLRAFATSVNPGDPSRADRAADLAEHERIHDLLSRTSRALARH